MERKEVDTQQFIDHTLLATELIINNNFMMDLMDHTGVFPKGEGPTNLSTNGHVAPNDSYTEKHTLTPPELNFHNTIFQFVNKHVEGEEPKEVAGDKEADEEFLSLNSSFLDRATAAEVGAEGGRDVVDAGRQDQQVPQPAYPALTIEPTVPIDVANALEDDDLLYAHSACTINARKVLPHKKRISRKLKGNLCSMDATDLEQQQQDQQQQHKQHVVQVPTVAANYSCEICGYAVHTQIEFYAHLKQHYDPGSLEQRLDVPQQQQQQQKEPLDMCGLSTQDKLQQEQAKLDQVFHDVQLNFDNFHSISHVDDDVVDDVGVNMVIDTDAMTDDKLTPARTGNTTSSNDVPVVDDVEFSDTEDMLEGIRNVVDKVSIEDTCDELVDLELTTSGMRAPWFNNNFSDIAFSGLLLPADPPATTTTAITSGEEEPLLKTIPVESQQLTLSFLHASKAEEQPTAHSRLEMGHKKSYIAAAAASQEAIDESNEEALLAATRTSSPSAGSAIEQLQRSPLMLSESFKLEDVEATAPAGSISSSPAATVADDNADSYLMETDKPTGDEANDASKRKFRCDKCARDFNSYNALKYHQHTHTQERAFECANCERSFYTLSALKAHARTHTDVKPYKCEQCENKFRQWSDLKCHIISKHSEIKAHMCEYCGKSFSRKYSLVVHRRIHTSERNYACQYCEKTFRASTYLLSHVKVHTGEKPYACAVCDKKFRVSGDLKRHARVHDPERVARTPARATATATARATKARAKLTQIEDEEDIINKSDAGYDEAETEILGL